MPFAQRVVTPIYISRAKRTITATSIVPSTPSTNQNESSLDNICPTETPLTTSVAITDHEFEAVTNLTLSNALRQLASLVLIANDIFTELNKELHDIGDRAIVIRQRIDTLDERVIQFDPKLVTVPESDLATFVQIKNHFKTKLPIDTSLFTPLTRSENLQQLYDAAAKTPVNAMEEMDRILGESERRSSDIFLCTPVLGMTRKRMKSNIDVEIETRMPAAVEELRKWTSTEAIGDITVMPDCITRVGYSNNLSQNNSRMGYTITANSISTSNDVTDDSNVINCRTNEITNDMPLDHRLPSPEEQCQIIALKFPAELIKVDISGRRFERMCTARKSMNVIQQMDIGDENNLNDDVQTVKRRSRSRKPRHKRRNTIAGTDQKEIEEAVKGDIDQSELPIEGNTASCTTTNTHVPRSKSNDILKKDSLTSSTDATKTIPRLSHFNTLKQWGRNRLRLIHRNSSSGSAGGGNFSCGNGVITGGGSGGNSDDNKKENKDKVSGVDDINVYETVISKNKRKFMEKERKLSHERKPSYSSSEKSLTIHTGGITNTTKHSALPASINPVKLRESSYIRRQRRNGLGHKDEPNSSSGNWSASSESGRTSIGSEITAQPKSSASSTSLNHHPGSGPPSSIISRRRFLNTSASSSVTSEGTVTPDIQVHDSYDDETSSAYSCDTEGYYTSFHVDSGLKTLKEEEPVTPLHTSSALSSTNSFGSSSNKTVLSAENEYELFGKGSTSTTASSAGTVCTTLMAANSDRCLVNGPAVPERKSSLTKLNRSNSNASTTSTLERSYSSSTVGSTLERTGTIKRNGILLKKEVAAVVHETTKIDPSMRIESPDSGNNTSSSPIETNSNSSPTHCTIRSNSEYDYSESSDLEGVDRVERIRVKTTINSSRIPSMCVITPVNSEDDDDDDTNNDSNKNVERKRHKSPVCCETDLDTLEFINDQQKKQNEQRNKNIDDSGSGGYATIHKVQPSKLEFKKEVQHIKKSTLQPLNSMFGRLRGVLPQLKKSPIKDVKSDEPIYDEAGEYVTICDVANNNGQKKVLKNIGTVSGCGGGGNGIYYSNDMLRRNLATVLSGNLNEETEYVSLNELPANIRCESNLLSCSGNSNSNNLYSNRRDEKINNDDAINNSSSSSSTTRNDCVRNINVQNDCDDEEGLNSRRGARVTLDAQGKVIYSSDSLKRRKGAHTTFIPGPCVKDFSSADKTDEQKSYLPPSSPIVSGGVSNRKPSIIRPVISQKPFSQLGHTKYETINYNLNCGGVKQVDKIVIRAGESNNFGTNCNTTTAISNNTEIVRMPIATVIAPTINSPTSSSSVLSTSESIENMSGNGGSSTLLKGAYVNVQGNGNLSTKLQDYQHLSHDQIDSTPKGYISSTLPRKPPSAVYGNGNARTQNDFASPFQRSNNIYWTLQARKQVNNYKTEPSVNPSKDDFNIVPQSNNSIKNNRPIEELYSTPNKIKNRKPELRSTPIGFSTFFSPVSKNNFESNLNKNETSKISPIDPRNTGTFKTSTPSKEGNVSSSKISSLPINDYYAKNLQINEGTSGGSFPNSPISSGRSTPRSILEPQTGRNTDPNDLSQNCMDRLGTPKTSLMDFKKLLLTKASKSTDGKSAVELLKISKDNISNNTKPSVINLNTSMNILDLSGSPKTFASRRMIRQGNFGSPSKIVNPSVKHMSPRSAWKFNNYRTDVMSTAIPEVNSEEDTSPNNSADRTNSSHNNVSPTIVEENLNMKQNIFLQAEENNFMKGEVANKGMACGLSSRAQLMQARSQFLMGNAGTSDSNTTLTTTNNNKQQGSSVFRSAQFKNGHYTGIMTSAKPFGEQNIESDCRVSESPTDNNIAPSLETAL